MCTGEADEHLNKSIYCTSADEIRASSLSSTQMSGNQLSALPLISAYAIHKMRLVKNLDQFDHIVWAPVRLLYVTRAVSTRYRESI